MRLCKPNIKFYILSIVLIVNVLFSFSSTYFTNQNFKNSPKKDSAESMKLSVSKQHLLNGYIQSLKENDLDSVHLYKEIAVINADLGKAEEASLYLEKYINNSGDFKVLDNDSFDTIKNDGEFEVISSKFQPKINLLNFIYLYIALIGFYFALVLNFSKDADNIAKRLISGFIAVHSLFILDFVFYSTNYQFKYPHTYLMSSSVALLYGPLLYFYFKRITEAYKFKAIDLLHLFPTLILLLVLLPVYSLPFIEKVKIQLGSSELYSQLDFVYIIFIPKVLSLLIYGYFIRRLYLKNKNQENVKNDKAVDFWKKGVYKMHVFYVISYLLYGISVSEIVFSGHSFIFHSQVIAMSLMVVYIVYMAQVQPKVFSKDVFLSQDTFFAKYQKSGLTKSLSEELKQNLVNLLVQQKVYKDNALNLEALSTQLNTSRHNTSQVINEHFNENFYEFLNDFRINEAKELLLIDNESKMNVTEILYEVGFNNKVSFNNAFKKRTGLTPTQFRNVNH